MDDHGVIEHSLALLAERVGDPTGLVYARLFADEPALAGLFVRDVSGMVRGQMLQVALECLLDHAAGQGYPAHFIGSERVNHQGLGVPAAAFDRFYRVVMASVAEALGDAWTPAMAASWGRATAGLLAVARA